MKKVYLYLFSILVIISCGKDSPFTEGYWEDGNNQQDVKIEEQTIETYNASLTSIISDQSLSGTIVLNVNLDSVNIQTNLLSVPSNIDVVRFSVVSLNCDEIKANGPPAPVSNNTYKNYSFTLSGNKNDLINSLNQGQIRDNNIVLYGIYGSNLPGQANLVFPVACGLLRSTGE